MLKNVILVSLIAAVCCKECSDYSFTYLKPNITIEYRPISEIVGGKDTTIEEHPYQVQVVSNVGFCGGSIISNKWVLTAAHCIDQTLLPMITVRAGTVKLDSGGSVYRVTSTAKHSLFDSTTGDYDYGLIKISGTFKFGKKINSIAIPAQNEDIPSFSTVVITGWGALCTGGKKPRILQSVSVYVFPQTSCSKLYENPIITDRMVCAGSPSGGKGSCNGDSGGPVVLNNVLVGVVSFGGSICAAVDSPSVFAKVSAVTNWIKSNTGIP